MYGDQIEGKYIKPYTANTMPRHIWGAHQEKYMSS